MTNDPKDDVGELLKLIEDCIEVPTPLEIQEMVAQRKEELEKSGIKPTRAIGKCDGGKNVPILCTDGHEIQILKIRHPVFGNLVDLENLWDHLNKESTRISQKSFELYGNPNSDKALTVAQNLGEIIRSESAKYWASELTQSKKGIRPAMIPGSVAKTEARNLYYGDESYSTDDTVQLALMLLKSITVGSSVSVYFEREFGEFIKEISKHGGFDMEEIGATQFESSYPFVTLVHLLIFVYENAGKDRGEVEQLMLQTSGVLYLTPGKKQHEKYMTFAVPSLRAFLNGWLMDEKKRDSLKKMFKAANGMASRSFAKSKKVRGDLDKMYNYLEIIATHLIDNGSIPWQPLRQLIDSLISEAFDLEAGSVYLGFVRDMVD